MFWLSEIFLNMGLPWPWHLAGDLRVVGSKPGRNLQAIFDPRLLQDGLMVMTACCRS